MQEKFNRSGDRDLHQVKGFIDDDVLKKQISKKN